MTMSGEKSKNNKKEITSYSDWMSQLPTELHSVPLYVLAIPGMLLKITQLMLQSYWLYTEIDNMLPSIVA